MSKVIFKTIFGSHLFGTSNENSDTDIRQIHMNSLEEIILKNSSNVFSDHSNPFKKNDKDDVDFESKELRIFIYDCLYGQTYAMDLLFSPERLWLESSELWQEIQSLKHKLVTNNVSPFVHYCKNMAMKYSKKGDKLKEIIQLHKILQTYNAKDRLEDVFKDFSINLSYEHIQIKNSWNPSSKKHELMLHVVDSSYPLTRQISECLGSISGKIDAFGKRSQKAMENDGTDLKAYYHSFRVCYELEELLNYGRLTFPNKFAKILLEIRSGKYSREFLDFWLTYEIERVLKIENHLPEPDKEFWNAWLLEKYLKNF